MERMERERKRSTSRSPSLSRRPSLKVEKKGVTLIAKKKKGSGSGGVGGVVGGGGKKERWLLTRKTWRFMTDTVGNLLPEYRTTPTSHGGGGGTGTGSGSGTSASTSRRGSGVGGARSTTSPPGQLQPHQLQQWTIQQQQWVQQHTSSSFSTGGGPLVSSSSIPAASGGLVGSGTQGQGQGQGGFGISGWQGASSAVQSQPKSKPTSPTSSTFPPWGSFPSHRPGVTPTGPGPGGGGGGGGMAGQQRSAGQFGFAFGPQSSINKYINPAVDPEDIPQVEQHFQDVCTKERKFLLWTRNKAKGLSGPALRDAKVRQAQEAEAKKAAAALAAAAATSGETGGGKKLLLPDYFSPDEYGDDEEEEEEDYDEYGMEEEDLITVRERRKSSTASSTTYSGPGGGVSFHRGAPSSHSDTSYSMIGGEQRVVRHTGSQTDPFPEELLIRLRLQAVHDERQKQIAAMQIQLQRQHYHQQQQQQQQGHQYGHQFGVNLGGGQHQSGGSGGYEDGGMGPDASCGSVGAHGMGPWYGGAGGINYNPTPGGEGHPHGRGPGGVSGSLTGSGSAHPTYGGNLRTVCLSSIGPGGGAKETVIPLSATGSAIISGGGSGSDQGQVGSSSAPPLLPTSGRESEEKVLSLESGGGGGRVGGVDSTDKKSEESGYSSSISDTVMKYLRIMRKNSKADNKETIDKFKTVNYDRSLRYIKSKNVTVEEALEHEKNKALGLSGAAAAAAAGKTSEDSAEVGGGVTKQSSGSTPRNPPPTLSSPPGEKIGGGGKVKKKGKEKVLGGTLVSPTSSSSSPPPPPHPATTSSGGPSSPTGEGGGFDSAPSSPPTSPGFSPISAPQQPTSPHTLEEGKREKKKKEEKPPPPSSEDSATTPTKKKTVKKGVKKLVGKEKSGAEVVATPLESRDLYSQQSATGVVTNPTTATPTAGGVAGSSQLGVGGVAASSTPSVKQVTGVGHIETTKESSTLSITSSSSPPPPTGSGSLVGQLPLLLGSPTPQPLLIAPPPKEVGIQAGESLIKYLRKLSDFSSSVPSASESPAELTSFSPRASFATSEGGGGGEWGLGGGYYSATQQQQHQQHQYSTTSSGIPTTTRSSFDAFSADLYSLGGGGGGDSSAWEASDWEDAWTQQLLLYQQLFQQSQGGGGGVVVGGMMEGGSSSSSSLLSPPPPAGVSGGGGKGGLSPIPASATGSSSGSSGGSSASSQPLSRRSTFTPLARSHALNVKISGSPPLAATGGGSSTPSTPLGGSGSSLLQSSSSHGGGGGLMKSFFSSSPFSSSFGFRSSFTKKQPSSTSSLLLGPPSSGGGSGSGGVSTGLGRGIGLPPTTSSSPNLLSLLHSSSSTTASQSSSGGSGFHPLKGHSHSSSGGGGGSHSHSHSGHSHSLLFRGSDRDVGVGSSSGFGLGGLSVGWGGGTSLLSRVGSRSHGSAGLGSKVTQKGQMSLPLGAQEFSSNSNNSNNTTNTSNPSSSSCSSTVMQKSKSSSSVVGGGGGGRERGSGTTTSSSTPPPVGGGGGAGTPTSSVSSSSKGLMSKSSRIFKSRSKSTTRGMNPTSSSPSATGSPPSCSWAPQGKCRWRSPSGKTITLEATNVLSLSELERSTLAEVALEKLKALSLGVEIKLPKEKGSGGPPKKRRPYLLKKKALSTGFFEGAAGKKEEQLKESSSGGSGAVFGISLSQCVLNDRLRQGEGGVGSGGGGQACLTSATTTSPSSTNPTTTTPTTYHRKRSQNGSRNSVTDVTTMGGAENKGSTESLLWGMKRGSVSVGESLIPHPPSSSSSLGGPSMDLLLPPATPSVPKIVRLCVQHLESYGLHTTGIFRVSTSLKRIRQLREEIDGGAEIEFGEEHSPHDVAALLKEFLRDLPDPLLSRELYQPFLKTQKIRNRKQQLEAVQHLVQLLPVANRDTLASLLAFFAQVVANAGETRGTGGEVLAGNKMEGYSLATLIAPNILPCMEGGGSALASPDITLTKERRESIDVVNYMISNHTQLFHVSPELLHDVYLHLLDTQPEAVEGILKVKTGGLLDDPNNDEMETSSVFEGSECGEGGEETASSPVQRVFSRREDILHEGAARGGPISGHQPTEQSTTTRLRGGSGSDRVRGRRDSSREGGGGGGGTAASYSDVDKGGQSGAESDSSSTKSSSRWFRRSRPDKPRTCSDSGSDKVRTFVSGGGGSGHGTHLSSSSSGGREKGSGGLESKRANSLDSVASGGVVGGQMSSSSGGGGGGGGVPSSREKSNSDTSLKVPENLNRRQSSPILESSGVITASLKVRIPVAPLPLAIDDSDIPFIEEDSSHPTPHPHHTQSHLYSSTSRQHHPTQQGRSSSGGHHPSAPTRTRGRSASASTDSSSAIHPTQSSSTATPICSSGHPPSSSELSSSPTTSFSPPGSPPFDPPSGFPYQEMTARILLGGGGGGSGGSDSSTTTTTLSTTTMSPDTRSAKVLTSSIYLQPAANAPSHPSTSASGGGGGGGGGRRGLGATPTTQTATASVYIPAHGSEQPHKSFGKEVRVSSSAAAGMPSPSAGLIKSKTADFEKLSQSHPSTQSAGGGSGWVGATTTPNPPPTSPGISSYSIAPKMRLRSQENIVLKQQFLLRQQQLQQQQQPSASEEVVVVGGEGASSSSSTTHSPTPSPNLRSGGRSEAGLGGSGPRPITPRRRQQQQPLCPSQSSSAIILSSSSPRSSSSHLSLKSPPPGEATTPSPAPTGGGSGGSSSRWKRSEIISSQHDEDEGGGRGSSGRNRSNRPLPETFL